MKTIKALAIAAVASCTFITAAPAISAQQSPAMIMSRTVCFDEIRAFETALEKKGLAVDDGPEGVNHLLQRYIPATSDRAALRRLGSDAIPASPNPLQLARGVLALCMASVGVAADAGVRDIETFRQRWANERPAMPPSAPPDADPVVMSAGAITIRQSEFEHALSTLPADYQTYARGAGKRAFAEDYLRMRLLADAGMKAGLAADADVIKQVEMMRANIIANAHLKTIEMNIDAGLRQKYESAGAGGDNKVYSRHILIGFKGSGVAQPGKPELTEQQAKAKADALHAQIVAGANFEEIAKKESDDVWSGKNGGDLGQFIPGQNVEEFDKAILATPPGQLAPVTRTQFGYSIIRVERRGATGRQMNDAGLKQERDALLKAELAKLVADAKPAYSESYFGAKKN